MNLSQTYPTTNEANVGNSFQLAPAAFAIPFLQASAIAHAGPSGNSFNLAYLANELKLYSSSRRRRLYGIQQKICQRIAHRRNRNSVELFVGFDRALDRDPLLLGLWAKQRDDRRNQRFNSARQLRRAFVARKT